MNNSTNDKIHLRINGQDLEYRLSGKRQHGKNGVLIREADDLSAGTSWAEAGYTVQRLLSENDQRLLQEFIRDLCVALLRKQGIACDPAFSLEKYHHVVQSDPDHYKLVKAINRDIPANRLPFPVRVLTKVVETHCHCDLSSINPYTFRNIFNVRIVRPMRFGDNNPPHKDVSLRRLRNAINIYVPIAGSDARSSLPLIPGSQHWNEADIEYASAGSRINATRYTVPAVLAHQGKDLEMIRPDPGDQEVLIFSPYLVHGGGYNLNPDTTRVSLEMRFWKPGFFTRCLEKFN